MKKKLLGCLTIVICLLYSLPCPASSGDAHYSILPTNTTLEKVLLSSNGVLYMGAASEGGLSLYKCTEAFAESALNELIPIMTLPDMTCYDLAEYAEGKVVLLCSELQDRKVYSHIYLVGEDEKALFLSLPKQLFSLCCFEQNIVYSYSDSDRAYIACVDRGTHTIWETCFEMPIVFSDLVATDVGVFCVGYYNESPTTSPQIIVAHVSLTGELRWLYKTQVHAMLDAATATSKGELAVIGTLMDDGGYYVGSFSSAGIIWEDIRIVTSGSLLVSCLHDDNGAIEFAYRRRRERKKLTIVSYDYVGNFLNEATLVVDNLEMPVAYYSMNVGAKNAFLLSGIKPTGEYIVCFMGY